MNDEGSESTRASDPAVISSADERVGRLGDEAVRDERTPAQLREVIASRAAWYAKNSATTRRLSLLTDGLSLSTAGFVPLLIAFDFKALGTIVSTLAIVLQSIGKMARLRELWVRHRNTANALEALLNAYDYRIGEFEALTSETASARLGRNFLAIVAAEQAVWSHSVLDNEQQARRKIDRTSPTVRTPK
jgi:hypothetical protein